jgi:hypothetical protein
MTRSDTPFGDGGSRLIISEHFRVFQSSQWVGIYFMDKLDVMSRLRTEGRWAEAEKFKNATLAEFKAKGVKNAVEEAWAATAAAFPPLQALPTAESGNTHPESPNGDCDMDVDALLADDDQHPPDLARDILWAHESRHAQQRVSAPILQDGVLVVLAVIVAAWRCRTLLAGFLGILGRVLRCGRVDPSVDDCCPARCFTGRARNRNLRKSRHFQGGLKAVY